MRVETILNLAPHDVSQLGRGRTLTFQLGDQQIGLRFDLPESNGAAASATVATRCSGCKRNLSDPKWNGKHARSCSKLRSEAASRRS